MANATAGLRCWLGATIAFASLLSSLPAAGADEPASPWRWQAEVKRQATNRQTDDESTRTTLRLEALSSSGTLALLRLDLPFPDEKTDFSGDPFNPRPGDLKVRAGFRAFDWAGLKVSPFVDVTFPTANPESLGGGKYQVSPGASSTIPLGGLEGLFAKHEFAVTTLVQQVQSVAGDDARKDISYLKLELGLRDTWKKDYSLKATVKPVIDWKQGGKTGAVGELEAAAELSRHWRVSLMSGGLLWGEGVPGTYGARVELTVRRRF